MNGVTAPDGRFALDVQGLDALRRSARAAPADALPQVARQFEALFIGMMLKSMRDASPPAGLLDGEQGAAYRSMLDQQLAQQLSVRGIGIADALLAQLRRTLAPAATAATPTATALQSLPQSAAPVRPPAVAVAVAPADVPPSPAQPRPVRTPSARASALPPAPAAPAAAPVAATAPNGVADTVRSFVANLGDAAREAAAACGLPHTLILAQAALESAWGRREVRGDDGSPTYNVFGIKADAAWRGRVVQAMTTEVVDGVARRVRASFRAYGSYAESFADYAKFLTGNPRYAGVLAQAEPARAAHALQRAGYATDPEYATKLVRVMQRLVAEKTAARP